MNEKESNKALRLRGRIWNYVQFILLIAISFFIWNAMLPMATACTLCVLIIGWVKLYKLRTQEVEKPYYRLWLNFVDGLLSVSVLGSIFIYDKVKNNDVELLLGIGAIVLFLRLIAHTIFSLAILREGKMIRRGNWAKLANLSIIITMGVYLLGLEHYKQVCMVSSLLLMSAATIAYLYWYYRDSEHRKPLSIASQITMSRIILTPFFLWVFFYDGDLDYSNNTFALKLIALLMVLGFMLTDFLDGYLARKMGEVSTLGKYLDPFSDKISNMTIFLSFIATGYAPVWMVALIYFREASVETLRTLAAAENVIMPARRSGKWKTALQGIGIVIILTGALDPIQKLIPALTESWNIIPPIIMGVITTITLISGIDYFISSKHVLKKYV
ncbi:MAG: CDP-diacylglycerol--glycerol-3-phosphate 3-phosphatidyltransferase [Fibrobacteraceae bacterium]|nr:CDP-diacylglycerol--glycerol-3-phosphate 3-phosphatidyltransferase [Fibrobacteraceae bacterium]